MLNTQNFVTHLDVICSQHVRISGSLDLISFFQFPCKITVNMLIIQSSHAGANISKFECGYVIQNQIKFSILIRSCHYVKSVQILSFFWSLFSLTRAEYRDLHRTSPYSTRVRKNANRKKTLYQDTFHAVCACSTFTRFHNQPLKALLVNFFKPEI